MPVAPWSRGAVDDVDAAIAHGQGDRLPADAQGHRRRRRPRHPRRHLRRRAGRRVRSGPATRRQRAFGSGVVFLERLVTGARHIEVQVIADGQGTAWALGVRDCSLQRRNQKVIEESASPVLTAEQVREHQGVGGAARPRRSATAARPRSSSSTSRPARSFSFLEVNTRLQVEHPITEVTTGFDLVKAQLHVAAGGRLEGDAPAEFGHAVEARLNAEDPDRDFAPSPGRIALPRLRLRPRCPGRHRRQRGRPHPGRLRLDDRQDHRLRPGPRRGARAAAPGAGRHHGPHRGRRDQQELPARPARPARGHRRQRRHRLDRPGPRRGSARGQPARRPRARRGRDRRRTRRRRRPSGRTSSPPRTAAARRPATRSAARSTSSSAASATGSPSPRSAPTGSASASGRAAPSGVLDVTVEQLDEFTSRLHVGDQVFRVVGAAARRRAPGRGRRHHPPGQPGRGRRAALPGAGAGRRRSRSRSARRSRPARPCSCSRA